MKTKRKQVRFYGVLMAAVPLVLLAVPVYGAGTNPVAPASVAGASMSPVPAKSGAEQQNPELPPPQALAVPHLQSRKSPQHETMPSVLPPQTAPAQAHRPPGNPASAGMPPGMSPSSGPGPRAGARPSDPRLMRANDPRPPQAATVETVPRHLPQSLIKKYDANKDGKLDAIEWARARQDMENRNAEIKRLRAVTNTVPAVSTNKPAAKPEQDKRKN